MDVAGREDVPFGWRCSDERDAVPKPQVSIARQGAWEALRA